MTAAHRERTDSPGGSAEPWQLRMFRRTLKKQQKLRALREVLGNLDGRACLLVTCGDNNGALNWHLRKAGGTWSWAEAETESAEQIRVLTGDPVSRVDKENPVLPFPDGVFQDVVVIDAHEHLPEPARLNRELSRVARPGGRVIVTTPNGDERKVVVRLKQALGMTPEVYGHKVVGYRMSELEAQLREVDLRPYARCSYARFFTELLELAINFAYVKILARRKPGAIAPQTREQLAAVGKSYRLYSLIYPLLRWIARLDVLDRSGEGYAVVVAARKVE